MESCNPSVVNKVALITGASSGIGEATSKSLAKAGVKVCMAARRQGKLASIKNQILADGGLAYQYTLDVTNLIQFQSVVEDIEANVGPIDILINNAGVMFYTHMRNIMIADWDRTIDVNCRGVTNGIACVLPGMIQRKSGHIVSLSSDAGRRGFPGLAVYSGSKFFVEGLSQGLRHEVKEHGIRVTCVQPGDCATEIFNYTTDTDAASEYGTAGTGKILNPEDVANAILYAVTQPSHVAVNEILVEPRQIPI